MTPSIDELSGSGGERLGRDLRAIQLACEVSASSIDRPVLSQASSHFALLREGARGRRRLRWSQLAAAAGLALAAVVAAWLGVPRGADRHLAGDITRDGTVDILDAFALAQRIESGDSLPPALDLDGDGRIDQRDVDVIATRAVALVADEVDPGRAGTNPLEIAIIHDWRHSHILENMRMSSGLGGGQTGSRAGEGPGQGESSS